MEKKSSYPFASSFKNEHNYSNLDTLHADIIGSFPGCLLLIDQFHYILQANRFTQTLLGFSRDELEKLHLSDIPYNEHAYGYIEKALFHLEETEPLHSIHTKLKKKNGLYIDVEISFCIIPETEFHKKHILIHIIDRSQIHRLKEQLHESLNIFRTIADFTYDWELWILPDNSVKYISPSCKRITGYSAEDFFNDPYLIDKITHPEDRKMWSHHHKQGEKKIARRELHFRILRKDGETRWLEHACQAVMDSNGVFLGYRSSNRDITMRKNYEEELRKALFEIELYKDQLEAESAYLKEEIKLSQAHEHIVGTSNALQHVLFLIEQVAGSDTTVLLLGETGTGKELLARTIHRTSDRKNKPLVKINCAALPASLIESELFGHEKGAFTNASSIRIGRFELADKATIFLDEIGELPIELQAKLLRVLQEGEFERIGGSRTIKVDVRVIAATNRNLEQDVRDGLFRKDLWYRLNVFPITAPPLRDRIDDIPQLVHHFMEIFRHKQKKNIPLVSEGVMSKLQKYAWPGNVRELENIIERAVITTTGKTLKLSEELTPHFPETTGATQQTLEEVERTYILKILEQTHWKVSGKNSAAEILGLKRSTLRARMEKHNLRKP